MDAWALDLGTTNSGLARWRADSARPELVELPAICRDPADTSALESGRMVPSAVHLLSADGWARLGELPFVRRRWFVGSRALIGRPALERNAGFPEPCFVPSFKGPLASDPSRPLARLDGERFDARGVARLFLRELLAEVEEVHDERLRELVVAVPVDAYERYRAELRAAAAWVGIDRLRFVDEPVAAAIGYGMGVGATRRVLVVDIGGGTMHAVLAELSARGVEAGSCVVLGKAGRAVGGNLVDRWVLDALAERLGLRLEAEPADEDFALWQRLALAEARRVKEEVHLSPRATFTVAAPEELRGLRARVGGPHSAGWSREDLERTLDERGFYRLLEEVLDAAAGGGRPEPDEVLLVGGSTLLPRVFPLVERRYGRDRLRAWQPFEAVALGAAVYAGGGYVQSDFIVHDYAILTHDAKTQAQKPVVIIPAGTRFPTPPDHWRRALVPTCPLGVPETLFKLVVAEIGRNEGDGRRFGWDASGTLTPLGAGPEANPVVPLNAGQPTLGTLDPPHPPGDPTPRLDVSFGVDADRWLVTTVRDLKTGKVLLDGAPVVRLL